ncbi:hypothetical protein AEA09_09750 [Lysinibacillus contaminans]|uniref:DUF4179 domain-containing protein n=1 Tax=Lysinibacillus contaminans TaxID=1293441 RepID=A0ABR5K1Q0_9BACI|nr:DUF4179 domain-containing protein [Lysinibacillus contaminans]KOS68794.1 hypothetical protein AEA09_09750 [Lysinibacillus contaminans]
MDKDIKRAIDTIQVPMEKLDNAIENGLKVPKRHVKPKQRRALTLVLSSVVTISLIIGLGFISPTMARVLSNFPLLNGIFETIDDSSLKVTLNDKNSTALNKTLTSNGVSLTIQDIVFDGTRLTISYLQEKQAEIYPLHIEVNGEVINSSGVYRGEYLESGKFVGVIEFSPTEQLPDDFDLLVKIHQIGDMVVDWQFNTPITNVNINSKKIAVGQKGEVEGIQYEVKKLELSDTGVSLHVLFHTDSNQLDKIVLNVLDDNGKVLPIINIEGQGDEKSFLFEYLMEPIGGDVESLTISPFFRPSIIERKEVTATLHEEQLPLTISQGKMGDLIVTKIEEQNGQHTMYYKLTRAFTFGARLQQSYLAVEDELGNNLVVTDTKTIAYNQYKLVFTKPAQGDIKLTTMELPMTKKDENAQITVDLSKTK